MEERIKNYLITMIVLLGIVSFLGSLYFIVIFLSDDLQDITHVKIMANHIEDNNLVLPFPNALDHPLGINHVYEYTFDLPLEEFHSILISNYEFSDGLYDCKYWSYVWALYWEKNKDKHNWMIEFIDTETHVFVMVYNSSSYCLMDQTSLKCFDRK